MALEPVGLETLQKINQVLGVESLNRPHAVLVDPGDFGTVFTYVPLFPAEYKKLPPELQRYVYMIGKERYGLVAFIPKAFSIQGEEVVSSVSEVYDEFSNLREVTYVTSPSNRVHKVENNIRKEMLQAFAKKKKIPVKKVIRSRS